MNVQKAILPGLFFGILCLIGFTNLLRVAPGTGRAMAVVNKSERVAGASLAQGAAQKAETNLESCSISPLYPQSIQQWCQIIERYARDNGVTPNLISAVMLQESAGRSDAVSRSGAIGLMQVMPRDGKAASFMCKNGPCFADRPSSEQLIDPEYNVAFAAQMLADLLRRHGDLREALRAYGPMDVGYYYADLVISIMNKHQ